MWQTACQVWATKIEAENKNYPLNYADQIYELIRQACDDGRKMWNEEYFWENWDIGDFYQWSAFQIRANSISEEYREKNK